MDTVLTLLGDDIIGVCTNPEDETREIRTTRTLDADELRVVCGQSDFVGIYADSRSKESPLVLIFTAK